MAYNVKETYYTLQGEGAQTGRAAVFCRFSGCNLWSGREADRSTAHCQFCDTDFVGSDGPGGGRFASPEALADHIAAVWPSLGQGRPYVVFTGGEPTLQLDAAVVQACHDRGFEVAIETNGTRPVPTGVDWICVSPKPGPALVQTQGDELKLVFPQDAVHPTDVEHLDFAHWFLQPKDGPERERNTQLAAEHCLAHPRWRLSLQTHKLTGLP